MMVAGLPSKAIVERRPRTAGAVGRRLGGAQNVGLLLALALLIVVIGLQRPQFFLGRNIVNIGVAVAVLGLLAVMQTVVIVAGGLDISVGSTAGLTSVVAATALTAIDHVSVGVAAGLVAGAACGAINGLLVTAGGVNPVIATLATFSAFRGIAFLVTDGAPVGVTNAAFNALGSGRLAGAPVPVLVFAAVALLAHVVLRWTDIGRRLYAIGGNSTAARLAGIDLARYRFSLFVWSGAVAGLAGVLLTARSHVGQAASGSPGLELAAITAALLGGAALTGGRGTISGAVLAVLLIGVLDNGLILLNVSSFYQLVARGALLIVAVLIMQWRGRSHGDRSGP